jgi:hypothetical protein
MSNKTIDINPALFNLGGSSKNKTRKNMATKNIKPIISPNILKNKLLKRIKEHKNKENKNTNDIKEGLCGGDNNITNISSNNYNDKYDKNDKGEQPDNMLKYSDEFNESINYLQSLSKQKKLNDEKLLYERNREKKRQELQNRTLKNYSYNTSQEPSYSTFVYNELPDELKEPLIKITNEVPIHIKYNIDNAVPYGNLKGGLKPTMRNWNRTQKNTDNYISNKVTILNGNNSNNSNTINNNLINAQRENKLHILKEKIKQKQLSEDLHNRNNNITSNISSNISSNIISTSDTITQKELPNNVKIIQEPDESQYEVQQLQDQNSMVINSTKFNNDNNDNNENNENNENKKNNRYIKQIHKKTISRKYTLGKSKIKNKVGILLKNRQTRKTILSAQKELKQHSINDIKKYLRHHNLIKIGSNAPNDILRKIYESSILTGDVTNNNKDILLHNFMKEEQQ